MVLRIIFFCFVFLLSVSCSTDSGTEKYEEEEKTEAVEPKSLYILHCESCHGLDGKKGLSNAADLSKSTFSDKQVKDVILNGNSKGMMPYKDIITSDADVTSLVQYVKTLRK